MVLSDGERDKSIDELPSDFDDAEDEDGFIVGERLVAPNATMYTTSQLHSMFSIILTHRC